LASPTNSLLVPNASSSSTDWITACSAGQKKKTMVIAICGATSAYGSQRESKRTRFSMCVAGARRQSARLREA
jgi:hypothetical protein